ncbi:MAG: hypothetical protein K9M11_01905 [Candidatus Pacebacteria bacterium]|nr:hypothetical protein [Candidatus Paceibacterota bacterium]
MRSNTQMLICCGPGCKALVHLESRDGFISSRHNKPFCSTECEDDFDPDIYRQEHPVVPEVRKTHKERFDAHDVFETLYGTHREEAAQDCNEGRDSTIQQADDEDLAEPPLNLTAFFADVKSELPTEPVYVLH